MLNQKSPEFKAFFLLQFTKELIKQSETDEIFELRKVLRARDEEKKEKIRIKRKEVHHLLRKKERLSKLPLPPKRKPPIARSLRPLITKKILPRVLKIPEPKLPLTVQYLKPSPTDKQIDLGKLNPLIKDPAVKIIECNGAEENVMVGGSMGRKKASIILSKDDINQIIRKFSETAKIPVQEGVFKVVVGRLILLAIISEVIGSKFIIRKMIHRPIFR